MEWLKWRRVPASRVTELEAEIKQDETLIVLLERLVASKDRDIEGCVQNLRNFDRKIDDLRAENARLKRSLMAQNEAMDNTLAENERLLGLIANPELLGVQVDERGIEVATRPREEIMRHLFVMCAHALGDTPNYVVCVFGPDDKGQEYELTLRRHPQGKTPTQVHEETIAGMRVLRTRMTELLKEAQDKLTLNEFHDPEKCALADEIEHFLEALDAAKKTP